ncbi:MAG: hypothetical protein IJE68_05235 [Clostridia bacterium]|nr:hypothetical protein [Clostridia bacterium]
MPRASYQYGTSPRKYEPEYTPRTKTKKTTKTTTKTKTEPKKSDAKKRIEKQRAKKVEERKNKTAQVVVVLTIFGMLLALSYREITIMEMFNQKKNLENQLATIQKENGQVEKNIREVESTLNWNDIYQTATDSLGMQVKKAIPVDLEKSDNVETNNKFIKEENTNIIEKIVAYFINK